MVIGVGAGLMAGSIPGFTIAMAIVLTLPFTFSMPPAQGLATMISVLVGGLSGGLMSGHLDWHTGNAIFSGNNLLTAFQWRVLAEPGLALGIGVWSSFCGGIISAILLVLFAPQLAMVGLGIPTLGFFHACDVCLDRARRHLLVNIWSKA
jgi:putative tricarboxylic transport membrane protein